eukprot:11368610-Alexandrium_andersonii.AAC.1
MSCEPAVLRKRAVGRGASDTVLRGPTALQEPRWCQEGAPRASRIRLCRGPPSPRQRGAPPTSARRPRLGSSHARSRRKKPRRTRRNNAGGPRWVRNC